MEIVVGDIRCIRVVCVDNYKDFQARKQKPHIQGKHIMIFVVVAVVVIVVSSECQAFKEGN